MLMMVDLEGLTLFIVLTLILLVCLSWVSLTLILMLLKKIDYFAASVICIIVAAISLGTLIFVLVCKSIGVL